MKRKFVSINKKNYFEPDLFFTTMTKKQLSIILWPCLAIGAVLFVLAFTQSSVVLGLIGFTMLVIALGVYRLTVEEVSIAEQNYNAKNWLVETRLYLSKANRAIYILCGVLLVLALGSGSLALILACGFILFALVWGYSVKLADRPPLPNEEIKRTEHGSAAWASDDDLKKAGIIGQVSGLYIGGDFLRNKPGHLCTIAGSGQGKGTCLIIPTLLVNPFCSYVVTDPKGENAFITARFQRTAGQQVYILDPWNEQEKMGAAHGIPSSGFNPFAFIKNDMMELRDNCEQIANYLVPDKPDAKDPYWNDRARSMIKILLMHIVTALPESDHSFWTLYKMLRLSDDDWLNLLIDLKTNPHEDELISIAAQELIGIQSSGNTMAGIKSTAQNATTIFESPQLRKSLQQDDFNPFDLTEGNATVYVVIPERFLDTHSVWLRLVIGLCLKACNSKPKKRVSFLLDEFAVLGKMKDVQRGFAFARGQNIVLWTFVQSLSQLKRQLWRRRDEHFY
jgi:type IV secretory pathway TraG/TraD family ATPase VirD4